MTLRSASTIFLVALSLGLVLRAEAWGPVVLAPKSVAAAVQQSSPAPQRKAFRAAQVVSASEVQYPLQTAVEGIVVFEVSLDERGDVTAINTLSDVPPLTDAAKSSLRSWKFKPASSNGTLEASQMLVAFAFRHAVKMTTPPPPLGPVYPPKGSANYTPAGILSAAYADYPASTIAAGATVVQANIQANGAVGDVRMVRTLGDGFAPLVTEAAKRWKFQPAALENMAVMSKVTIAFVFSSRALNPF